MDQNEEIPVPKFINLCQLTFRFRGKSFAVPEDEYGTQPMGKEQFKKIILELAKDIYKLN